MDDYQPVDRLSLAEFLRTIRRWWYVVLACVVAVPAIAYFMASREEKRYEATAKVLFRNSGHSALGRGAPPPPGSEDSERATPTILDLLTLSTVAERTARSLGGGLTAGDVAGSVQAASTGQSNVYSLTASAKVPGTASRIANAYAEQFVKYRQSFDRNQVARARRTFQQKLGWTPDTPANAAHRQQLGARISQLRTLESLQDGYVEVVQRAGVPNAPVWPVPKRNAAIGLGVGLLLGILLALLFDTRDRRLRSLGSVEAAFERPILGAIAKSRAFSEGAGALPPAEREAFRMLRANLRFSHHNGQLASVLVTSAGLQEGKSTVAWNLALAAADAGMKVLLIEADLRRPGLARRLGASPESGLSDVLTRGAETADAVDQVVGDSPEANGSRPAVDVIFAGAPMANPVDSIESRQMAVLLHGAEMRYDLVVVDTPPLSVVPDAIPLVSQVSGVIVVARLGKTTREAASHVRAQLEHLDARLLGVVVNSTGRGEGFYGYAYRAAESYEPEDSTPAD